MDATLAVTMLQLLYMIYVEQRRRSEVANVPDPQRVQELIEEIKQSSRRAWDNAEFARRIDQKFEPEEAKRVKEDLALFQLFAEAPNLDRFDYWGLLNRFVSGLQKLATKNHLFRLRGRKVRSTSVLDLTRTSEKLLPSTHARAGIEPQASGGVIGIDSIAAWLLESASNFPVRVAVRITIQIYHGIPGNETHNQESAIYSIVSGQQPHWLRFEPNQDAYQFRPFEFMLTAPQFKDLVQALRDDIHAFVAEVKSDDKTMAPLFEQIDSFLGRVG